MKILYLLTMVLAATLESTNSQNPRTMFRPPQQSLFRSLDPNHRQTLAALRLALSYLCKRHSDSVENTIYPAFCQYLSEEETVENRVKKGSLVSGGGGDNTALAAIDVLKGKLISYNNNKQRQSRPTKNKETPSQDKLTEIYDLLQRMGEQGK